MELSQQQRSRVIIELGFLTLSIFELMMDDDDDTNMSVLESLQRLTFRVKALSDELDSM